MKTFNRCCCGFLLMIGVMSGCAVHKPLVEPPVEPPASFSTRGAAPLPDMWWQAFDDKHLNHFIQRALTENFSIKAGWNRLRQAHALVRQKQAGLSPTADWGIDQGFQVRDTDSSDVSDDFSHSFGVSASYEIDLWGRIRSAVDAQRMDARAAIEDLQTSMLTLSAEIAETWYRIIEHRGQIQLMNAQIATNAKYLDIITEKFKRGQVSAADMLQQKQAIEAIRGRIHNLEWNLRIAEHQLRVYLAAFPDSLELPETSELPALPRLPETGLPAKVVNRRPDVKAAWLLVQGRDLRVAEALSNRYPRLSISANAALSSDRIEDIFKNWLANLTASLVGPIIDGHERAAKVDEARASLMEKINLYGQTVMNAVREVEDALIREKRQRKYIESLKKQYALADQAAAAILNQYIQGAEDYTRYLSAQLSYQNLERTLLEAQRDLVINRISLYRALAGGLNLDHWKPAAGQAAKHERITQE